MPSNAYGALTTRLKDVDELMTAHAAVGGTHRGRRFEVEGLNRAAVLMLSAHFEGYLEDVMSEAVEALNQQLNPQALTGGVNRNRKMHQFQELKDASPRFGRRSGGGP